MMSAFVPDHWVVSQTDGDIGQGCSESTHLRSPGIYPTEISSASALMQASCHQGPLGGNLTFLRAEVQSSGAQTQPGTQVADSLWLQLDQQLDCGDNRARLGVSSAIGSLDAKMGSGNQWMLIQGEWGSWKL